MIRQSIVRGIVGAQKRRAKSACDATAMLRFFRAQRGAARHGAERSTERGATGCVHYFQHRFCAFRPLTHSTANHYTHSSLFPPFGSADGSPSLFLSLTLLSLSLFLSRRTRPQTSIFRIFDVYLSVSVRSVRFFALALSGPAMKESISSI